jgi:hypothetical protein
MGEWMHIDYFWRKSLWELELRTQTANDGRCERQAFHMALTKYAQEPDVIGKN